MKKIKGNKVRLSIVAMAAVVSFLVSTMLVEQRVSLSAISPKEVHFVTNKLLPSTHLIEIANKDFVGIVVSSAHSRVIVTSAILTFVGGEQEKVFPLEGETSVNQKRLFQFPSTQGAIIASISLVSYSPDLFQPSGIISVGFISDPKPVSDKQNKEIAHAAL